MTNEEKIKALKENTSAFGLMPKELKHKAIEIGKKEFRFLERGLSGWYTCARDSVFGIENIFRLRPDYAEEPEVIELEIYADYEGDWCVNGYAYIDAPALCPKEGYRFAGYRYKEVMYLTWKPMLYVNEHMMTQENYGGSTCGSLYAGTTAVFPTHAVYKKEVK